MNSLSLYVNGNSFVHRVSPVTKIFYILAAVLIPIIAPGESPLLVFLVCNLVLLSYAGVVKKVISLAAYSLILLISIVIIQGMFRPGNATLLFRFGPLMFYKEGLYYALKLCLRVLDILTAFSILVFTTKPSDLIEALEKKGLSPRMGYVLSSVLQIIPRMKADMDTITDAQRARGMETEGRLIVRIKAFIPLIGPVIMSSLANTKERAMALEVRGFNSKRKKTYLNEFLENAYDRIIQLILAGLFILTVIWRVLS